MVRLDDMRLFAELARAGSMSAAAAQLGMPKQTLSRRLAELEAGLGVQLAIRTTRHVRLTDVGRAYAERCEQVVRLADDANRAATDDVETPRGTLRLTADFTIGTAFLPGLLARYAVRYPEVALDVMLTSRPVDLVEEGIDLAIRVGRLQSSSLIAVRLGPAKLVYCASPTYLAERGWPRQPRDLVAHACITLVPEPGPARWPFSIDGVIDLVPIEPRVTANAIAIAERAILAGLGIGNLPEFAWRKHARKDRLRAVLQDYTPELGSISLVYPPQRHLAARVRAFVDLAVTHLRGTMR